MRNARTYATVNPSDPKPPKPDKDDKNQAKKDKGDASEEADPTSQKHARNPEKSTLEETKHRAEQVRSESQHTIMSEDLHRVEELVAHMKKHAISESQAKTLDALVILAKRRGLTPELKEMLAMFDGSGKRPENLDLASITKIWRSAAKLAKMSAEEVIKEEQEHRRESGDADPDTKSEKSKERGKKSEGAKDSSSFGVKEIKLDLGTALISTLLSWYLYKSLFPGETKRDITWQEFRTTFFDKGLVEKLTVINHNRVRVELRREAVQQMYPESPAANPQFYYYFTIGSVEAFERKLDEAHKELGIPSSERIPVSYTDDIPWAAALFNFAPTLLLVGGLFWVSRRAASGSGGNSGIFGIGKSRAKKFNHETDIKIKFSDVAGMDEAKVEIMEFVEFLKNPEKFQKLGAKIPRGAILSGPPGTGKTLLAKATAGESGVPFFSVSGSEFVEMFVGVGASRVRDLFANARKSTPCIIFIDEIDAIGKSRSKQNFGGGNDEREATLNQILTEMDGFNTSEQVVVLAGTNRPDVLDRALMRPGRFDRHISIDRPTMDGRKQIFAVHLRKIITSVDMEYLTGRLSALTPGFSGADIANCVNEAALIAARASASEVTMQHFEAAIERVIGGLEKKSLVLTPEEKKTVAYHEAGHAICGWYFKYADPLLKVSIIPRGQGALGYAQYLPAGGGDVYLMNVRQLMDRMAMTLGGRVSEELWFDTVTSGASDDFNKVTRMATAMVTEWGMSSKIGYLSYKDDEQRLHKPFSEETARNIDSEVRRIVDEAYKQCRNLLEEKREQVGMVAEELLKKEMLVRDDLVRLLGPRPHDDPGEFSKYFDNSRTGPEGGSGLGGGKSAPPPPPTEDGPADGDASGPVMPSPAFRRLESEAERGSISSRVVEEKL